MNNFEKTEEIRKILIWKAKNIQRYIKKIELEAQKRIKELDNGK